MLLNKKNKLLIFIILIFIIITSNIYAGNSWNIESDKAAHFTLYASSYILTDFVMNEWLELELNIAGVNICPYLPTLIIFPIALTSERWLPNNVYNPKDTWANVYGLGFGISIRLLNKL